VLYINQIENKMESIFSNLPNNLIMNIIKMETDRVEKETTEELNKNKLKFVDCIKDLNFIEEDLKDYYSRDERDEYYSHINYAPAVGEEWMACSLADIFTTISEVNFENKRQKEKEEYYKMMIQEEVDRERYFERRYENNFDEPQECDYDFYEPDWV